MPAVHLSCRYQVCGCSSRKAVRRCAGRLLTLESAHSVCRPCPSDAGRCWQEGPACLPARLPA
eukprot:365595-Chlamydomonas_euryale.AAC.22